MTAQLVQVVTEGPLPVPIASPPSAWRVWHCPDMRRLVPGDIPKAITWYRELTGEAAKIVCLSPKNEHLTPQGIECRIIGGVSRAEIWLAAGEPQPVVRGQFDAGRDQATIKAGGFFCLGCLTGKPAAEKSPDGRYCQWCYDNLLKEADIWKEQHRGSHPAWIPRQKALAGAMGALPASASDGHNYPSEKRGVAIMSMPKKKVITKRGPRFRELPEARIRELHTEGMGAQAIADKLREDGIEVSYRTIERRLSGG